MIFPTKRGDRKSRSLLPALGDQKKKLKTENALNVFRPHRPEEFSDCRDAIVFEKLCFLNVFLPHENEKPALSNSSGSMSVFEKLRFRDGLVWTECLTGQRKLQFQIPICVVFTKPQAVRNSLWVVTFYRVTVSRNRPLQEVSHKSREAFFDQLLEDDFFRFFFF